MRNLKKILALVLALVMSLSLMATAGASSFPDVDAENPYATAIEVLDELKVFQGYKEDGTFRPTETLNRAQAAVLVYRIATGDVEDKYLDNYTYMQQSKFADLDGYNWAKGYINYCQNAGIVVGTSATTFDPGAKVTGYQLLVMLLRTLGYGKAGEFSDPKGWELQTSTIAEREGILKNVIGGDFGAPAARQMVAEILFRGLLSETVEYSALVPGGYTKSSETLGKRELGLEEVEGVVIANEYADLYDTDTLTAGKTMVREGDKTYTINYGTNLDDLGESRLIYVQNKNTVLSLADSGKNIKDETTDKMGLSALLDRAGISESDAESYVNFGQGTNWHSDWKIRYEITIEFEAGDSDTDMIKRGRNAGFILPDYSASVYDHDSDGNLIYSKEFRIGDAISAAHQNNIEEIFNIADKKGEDYIDGEVYVGTSSKEDISDKKSFKQFLEEYIDENDTANVSANERGNWLKVIDNNGDGQADYILKVIYTFAQVSRIRDEKITLDVKDDNLVDEDNNICSDVLNELTGEPVVTADELSEDDVVYYAIIDGKAQTYKAATETATIDKINRNARTATSTDGTEWTESQVHEHIEDESYDSTVGNLVGKVSYDLFFDRGGYLAAFIRSDLSNNFKLILDGWYNETKSGPEYAVKVYNDETGKVDTVDLNGTNSGLFISGEVDGVLNNDWNALKFMGGVNEADGALDGTKGTTPNFTSAVLNGGSVDAVSGRVTNTTKTTVASISEDGTILPVHSRYVTGRNNHDMIDMLDNNIPTQKSDSTYGHVYGTTNDSDTAYESRWDEDGNPVSVEVIARADTVYYVVNGTRVVKVATGYKDAPTKLANVEDVYVVGTLRDGDNLLGRDSYYTADIVVIEVSAYENDYEVVFVLDDETSSNDVSRRNLRVIGEDGKEKNVDIWNGSYTLSTGDYGYTTSGRNGVKILPGLYKLYDRSDDLYTLDTMTAEEIRDAGFIAGATQYVTGVAPKDFVVLTTVGVDEEGDPIYGEESVTLADGVLYHVRYNTVNADRTDKKSYHYTEPTVDISDDYRDILAGGVEGIRSSEAGKNGNLDREFPGSTASGLQENWDYFYNDVLVKWKDGKMIYAISFANIFGGRGNEKVDFAQWIWNNNIPAATEVAPATDMDIKVVLGANESVTLTYGGNAELLNTEGDNVATFSIPDDVNLIDIEIAYEGAGDLAAIVPGNGWVKVSQTGTKLRLAREVAETLSIDLTVGDHAATVYTVAGAQAVINAITAAADEALTGAQKEEYNAILNGIKNNLVENEAVGDAGLADAVNEAITAVNDADEAPDLTEAKATATQTVTEYKKTEIEALGAADKAALAEALEAAKAAITAAETQEAIDTAVQEYKDAVDAKIPGGSSTDIADLTIAVGSDGAITGDTATAGGTLSYYFVETTKATEIAAWTTETTAEKVGTDLGVSAEANKPTISDNTKNGKFLVVVEIKDGKVVAAGQSEAIAFAVTQ